MTVSQEQEASQTTEVDTSAHKQSGANVIENISLTISLLRNLLIEVFVHKKIFFFHSHGRLGATYNGRGCRSRKKKKI